VAALWGVPVGLGRDLGPVSVVLLSDLWLLWNVGGPKSVRLHGGDSVGMKARGYGSALALKETITKCLILTAKGDGWWGHTSAPRSARREY